MAKITFEDKNYFAGQPFNQLKDSEVNEIKDSVNALYGTDNNALGYAVVTELPATIPIGVQLLYNGTMWRGLLEGESSLAAGTPWPVKGYKEWIAELSQQSSNAPIIEKIFKDTFFVGTDESFTSYRVSAGVYELRTTNNLPELTHDSNNVLSFAQYRNQSGLTEPKSLIYSVSYQRVGPPYSFVTINFRDFNATSVDEDFGSVKKFIISIKLYPPAP
jgi:hypothetical protein